MAVWNRGVVVADPPLTVASSGRYASLSRVAAEVGLSVRGLWSTQPAVRKVTSFIADSIGSLPWRVYVPSDGGRERAYDSPAETLVRRPARHETSQSLISGLVLDTLLYGTSLALLLDGEIVRVPPPLERMSSSTQSKVRVTAFFHRR